MFGSVMPVTNAEDDVMSLYRHSTRLPDVGGYGCPSQPLMLS
ncbi:MAG: hypothetical protein QOC61_2191 [Acidobacteriota bacterium]|jgi:hypothetical protein|nr:hypothetical protein [Acidobacteriota bacterium]